MQGSPRREIAETAAEIEKALAVRQRVLLRIGDLARGPGSERYADEAEIKEAGLAADGSSLMGAPEEITSTLQTLADGGIDTVLLTDPNGDPRSLERFAAEIAPNVQPKALAL